jgi:hypothetical protein
MTPLILRFIEILPIEYLDKSLEYLALKVINWHELIQTSKN